MLSSQSIEDQLKKVDEPLRADLWKGYIKQRWPESITQTQHTHPHHTNQTHTHNHHHPFHTSTPTQHTMSSTSIRVTTPDTRFQFGVLLGKGAFASVFKAVDLITKKTCAVKKIVRKTSGVTAATHPLLEYLIGKNLKHSAILTPLDCLQTPEAVFIQFELVDGGDLFSQLSPSGTAPALDQKRARKLSLELASGVAYLHSKNVIHCDLKPENVLVHKGHVKICDFGLAGIIGTARKGVSVGTGAYMAPELLSRRSTDPLVLAEAHDTWSFGIILYAMLFGDLPFERARAQKDADFTLFTKHGGVSKNVYPFSLLTDSMADLLGSVLSINAAERPTMVAVAEALKDKASWYANGERGELEFFGLTELQAVEQQPIVAVKPLIKADEFDTLSMSSSTSSGSGRSIHRIIKPFKQLFSAAKTKAKHHKQQPADEPQAHHRQGVKC
jgi:serine/threonine protein kinase